jgi:hypothetical protein
MKGYEAGIFTLMSKESKDAQTYAAIGLKLDEIVAVIADARLSPTYKGGTVETNLLLQQMTQRSYDEKKTGLIGSVYVPRRKIVIGGGQTADLQLFEESKEDNYQKPHEQKKIDANLNVECVDDGEEIILRPLTKGSKFEISYDRETWQQLSYYRYRQDLAVKQLEEARPAFYVRLSPKQSPLWIESYLHLLMQSLNQKRYLDSGWYISAQRLDQNGKWEQYDKVFDELLDEHAKKIHHGKLTKFSFAEYNSEEPIDRAFTKFLLQRDKDGYNFLFKVADDVEFATIMKNMQKFDPKDGTYEGLLAMPDGSFEIKIMIDNKEQKFKITLNPKAHLYSHLTLCQKVSDSRAEIVNIGGNVVWGVTRDGLPEAIIRDDESNLLGKYPSAKIARAVVDINDYRQIFVHSPNVKDAGVDDEKLREWLKGRLEKSQTLGENVNYLMNRFRGYFSGKDMDIAAASILCAEPRQAVKLGSRPGKPYVIGGAAAVVLASLLSFAGTKIYDRKTQPGRVEIAAVQEKYEGARQGLEKAQESLQKETGKAKELEAKVAQLTESESKMQEQLKQARASEGEQVKALRAEAESSKKAESEAKTRLEALTAEFDAYKARPLEGADTETKKRIQEIADARDKAVADLTKISEEFESYKRTTKPADLTEQYEQQIAGLKSQIKGNEGKMAELNATVAQLKAKAESEAAEISRLKELYEGKKPQPAESRKWIILKPADTGSKEVEVKNNATEKKQKASSKSPWIILSPDEE